MVQRLVFLGAPGSGKGTQAAILAEKLGIKAISTGGLLREAVRSETEVGRKVEEIMTAGDLVDDETMAEVVKERVQQLDEEDGFIFDGYPRNLAQADTFQRILQSREMELDAAILIQVPEEVLTRRLLARGRLDDTETAVSRRIELYGLETRPLIGYYESMGLLRRVDGSLEIDEVASSIMGQLELN
jgi:adenylate kinase